MPTTTTGPNTHTTTGTADPPLQQWERQPNETNRAFAAFTIYRDLGPAERSHPLTAARLFEVAPSKVSKVRLRQIKDWSSKYGWVVRVEAYDRWVDAQARQQLERDAIDMRSRHARHARTLIDRALKALEQTPTSELTPRDIVRYIDVATRIERQALGEPDLTIEHTELSEDQLQDRAAAKLEQRASQIRAAAEAIRDAMSGVHGDDEDEDAEE